MKGDLLLEIFKSAIDVVVTLTLPKRYPWVRFPDGAEPFLQTSKRNGATKVLILDFDYKLNLHKSSPIS